MITKSIKSLISILNFTILICSVSSSYAQLVPSNISTVQLSASKTLVTLSGGTNTVVYNVSTNQILTLESSAGYGSLFLTTATGGVIELRTQDGNGFPAFHKGAEQILTGLQNITFSVYNDATAAYVTFSVENPSTNSVSYTPVNSVVIPSDATGPVQIVLESSSDMVNWVASQPGTYGSTYTNRFFRVRAIANSNNLVCHQFPQIEGMIGSIQKRTRILVRPV